MLLPTSVLVWSNLCSTTRVFRRFSQDLSEIGNIPSGKLTWLWKITNFKGLTNQIWGLARVYMVSITYIITGWWFGTWILFFHSVGNFIIPTDELIFFRGVGIPPTSHALTFLESTAAAAELRGRRANGTRTRRKPSPNRRKPRRLKGGMWSISKW